MKLVLTIAVLACAACDSVPPDTNDATRLRVLSYNIKRGYGNDGVADLGRAADLIRDLEPDLVLLQEIDDGVERSGREDQMARLGAHTGLHARFGPFFDYQGGEYGMGLLSRFPILESNNHPLPDGAEPRTALDARVRLPNGDELVMCGIHLYASESERLAQAQRVVEVFADTDLPMILGGDFNSRPGSSVMTLVDQHWTNPDKGEDRFTMSSTNPRSEIDFVLYRPADRFRVVSIDVLDEPVVSDHRPVLLILDLLPAHEPTR